LTKRASEELKEMDGLNGALKAAEDVEVAAKAQRRRFPTEYKRRILREADACTKPGEIGALLRREGLYSSILTHWRQMRERGELAGLAERRRGPKPATRDGRDQRIVQLERECARQRARAERAEALVEIQKKVAQLLGLQLPKSDDVR
jgi:transposase-like protein